MSLSAGTRTSLWLMPDPAATALYAQRIATLAARFAGPRFAPHLTLLGHSTLSDAALPAALARLAADLPPLTLTPIGLDHAADRHRCCAVLIAPTAALRSAHAAAAAACGAEARPFTPHLSLLYAELDTAQRTALVAELTADRFPTARAASLEAWSTAGPEHTWRCRHALPLA